MFTRLEACATRSGITLNTKTSPKVVLIIEIVQTEQIKSTNLNKLFASKMREN